MHNEDHEYRSLLSKVKGLGAAKNGTDHWVAQRITALALIPLVIWFIIIVIKMVSSDQNVLINIIQSPINIVAMMLFITTTTYHGFLGIQIIIEDYVAEPVRSILVILIKFFSIITVVSCLSALITLRFAFLG